ncbi:hypothetical protein Clacol_005544 [Clathrus columnatus]|uniref:MFS general substrate transporter n=1 Tax=Clathrus columnatus TaxID=1419009 RepID=A0AAV5A9L7_9AGAM|nr:hypothetical protein Clacol_005544 [Clathrus columnatus]
MSAPPLQTTSVYDEENNEKASYHNSETTKPEYDFSTIDEKKLLRKLDWALVPWGNARLYNLEKDLHINDTQYNIALTIFFFSYAIFEVPSNVFLKRLRPSIWLSLLMLLWGIMMTVQGLVHNYGGLLGMRWMLGTFEAGLFPGVNFYLSWYKRSEFGIRAAFFFSAATVSGAFGGLLAAAISNMEGVGGKPAWAWIFILEGLATVLAGALSFWIIQDFPDNAKFLTETERAFVVRRLQEDDQFSAAGENLRWKYIFDSLKDWKTWIGRFEATPANLLTVPIYVWACFLTCGVGYFADKYGHRGYFNLAFFVVGAAGYIILIASKNAALSYFAVYLAASGIYPLIPNTIAWFSNNVEGSYKRSVTLAMIISFGNINGAVSSNVFLITNAHVNTQQYQKVLYIAMGWITTLIAIYLIRRENARRQRGERDEIIRGINDKGVPQDGSVKIYESLSDVKKDKGDHWSGYTYTL